VGVAFDLYPSFGIIIQFMTVLSLLGCKFNNLYIIDLLKVWLNFVTNVKLIVMMKKILSIQLLKIFLIKIQKKIFLIKNREGVINEKILSDAELKIIFNTRDTQLEHL
jgi:hypothetical protein